MDGADAALGGACDGQWLDALRKDKQPIV